MSNAASQDKITLNGRSDTGVNEIGRAARGSAFNLVGAGVSALGSFGLTVLVAQGTTKEEAGVFFTATSLFVLVAAGGQLGTDSGLVYFFAQAFTRGERGLLRSYLRVAMWPVLVFGMAVGIAMYLLAPVFGPLISPHDPDVGSNSVRALSLFVPFAGVESVSLSATRGLGTMRPNVLIEQVMRPGLQLLLATLILFANLQWNLSWAWAIPYSVAAVAAFLWLTRLLPRRQILPNRVGVGPEFWKFSAPRSLATVAQLAMQRLDIVLVGVLAGPAEAAVYTAATRFVVLGQLARNAVSLALQPQLAKALSTKSHDVVRDLYRLSTAWLIAVSWPIYITLLMDGSVLLSVFGSGYGVASSVLTLLSLSMLIATFCGDVDVMLIMSGRTLWSMINVVSALVINVALDIWLIPLYGFKGAAIGWSVAIAAKNLIALIEVGAVFRLHPVGRGTIIAGCSAVLCFAGAPGAVRIIFGAGLVPVVVGLACACVAYAALLWRFREQLALRDLMARRFR